MNSPMTMHHVSSAASEIPYGGFSPVRLQIDIPPRPSPLAHARQGLIRGPQSVSPAAAGGPSRGKYRPRAAWDSRSRGHRRSKGPWLASGLCCPAGSSLTMASSEPLLPTRRLIGLRPAGAWGRRGSQLLSACPCFRAVCLTPVDSVVFGCCSTTDVSLRRHRTGSASTFPGKRRFTPGGVTRLHSSLYAAARKLARPSPTRAFTVELSSHESPRWNVDYHYAGKQPISRGRTCTNWTSSLVGCGRCARMGGESKIENRKSKISPVFRSRCRRRRAFSSSRRRRVFNRGFHGMGNVRSSAFTRSSRMAT
jgi:hypothetical protein